MSRRVECRDADLTTAFGVGGWQWDLASGEARLVSDAQGEPVWIAGVDIDFGHVAESGLQAADSFLGAQKQ